MVAVKICGVARVEDAVASVEAGADAIGLNFSAASPRCCDPSVARRIVGEVAGRILTVGVFVDAGYDEIVAVRDAVGFECVQLHGDEPPELLERLLPHAYKALRVRDDSALQTARRYAGEYVLLDSHVPGVAGGTGATFDWTIAARLARERKLTLAGGLTPSNVVEAIQAVQPFCVDVASGVEKAPGLKDRQALCDFVRRAKSV